VGTVFSVGYTGYVRHDEIGTDADEDWSVTSSDMITYTMLDKFMLNTFDSVFGRNKYSAGYLRLKIVLDDIDTSSPPDLTLTLKRKDLSTRRTTGDDAEHYTSDVSYVRFAVAPSGVLNSVDSSAEEIYTAAHTLFSALSDSDKMYFDSGAESSSVTYSVTGYSDSLVTEDGRNVLYVMMEADYDPKKVIDFVQDQTGYMKTLRLGETETIQFVGDLEDVTVTLASGD
jgi:hypothetical protein